MLKDTASGALKKETIFKCYCKTVFILRAGDSGEDLSRNSYAEKMCNNFM